VKHDRLQHEAKITEARVRNQAVILPGLLFPPAAPLALLADSNITEHEAIRRLEERVERLDRIRVAKRCSAHWLASRLRQYCIGVEEGGTPGSSG